MSRPGLWERLDGPARVTVVSAPPGSGKTVLLRSWIGEAGLGERAAWVLVGRDERDAQRFWLSVLGALRQTVPGSALVRAVTAMPDLDGWAIVEWLLTDLAPLEDRLWLMLDDLHELGSDQVRRQLLRTSVLERVNGELADLLTGGSGGGRVLQDLEEANAFVVSLDAARSWFRYHHLFADLLQLELRRTEPSEVAALHELAAGWFAGRGFAVEAIRHAQAARDWGRAARLLADHWPGLHLAGRTATVHALLTGFPAEARASDAELAALTAADELAHGSLEAAERYLGLAERGLEGVFGLAPVPACWRGQALVLLVVVRLLVARQQGNPPAVAEEARRLRTLAETLDATQPGLGEELRALGAGQLGHHRVLGGPFRGGRTAPGRGRHAGAPDRQAVP